MYNGLGAPVDLALDDPILSGEGSGECSAIEDMFFMCEPSTGPSIYTAPIGPALPPGYRAPGFNLSYWLQQNAGAVYLGAGALVLMAMFGGKRK